MYLPLYSVVFVLFCALLCAVTQCVVNGFLIYLLLLTVTLCYVRFMITLLYFAFRLFITFYLLLILLLFMFLICSFIRYYRLLVFVGIVVR